MIERLNSGQVPPWVKQIEELTKGATAGTKMYPPNTGLKGGETIEIGNTSLKVYYQGKAHTDNDIMVEVAKQKTIFLGDIVMVRRISSQPQDGDINGQINTIRFVLTTGNKVYVPGHGKTGGENVPKKTLAYLENLYSAVKKYYEEGLSDFEMKEMVEADLKEFSDWSGFDSIGRVISHIYLEVEEESFLQ